MLGQTFELRDLATILLLIVLEAVLSIDNALVLGLLAKRVTPDLRLRALSYGLIGALLFRLVAVALAALLLKWSIIKLLGGAYLLYVALEYFLGRLHKRRRKVASIEADSASHGFWATVAAIELTDIAFAIDSILAAVALVGSPPAGSQGLHPKLWVIVTGGMLGVILMRFAAAIFIKLLERFPHLNRSAYLLVFLIGLKLIVDYAVNSAAHPDRLNFQNVNELPFWIFWGAMALCLASGFNLAGPRRP